MNVVRRAARSAVRLVDLVTQYFPGALLRCGAGTAGAAAVTNAAATGFRDHAVYRGRQVFFYKRAQILAADVWAAYGRRESNEHGVGFADMHRLTMFGACL